MANQPLASRPSLSVSEPLSHRAPIKLLFVEAQIHDPAPLQEIGLRVGTYMTSHTGEATLRLWTTSETTFERSFALSSLTDNAYIHFKLDGRPYVGGEIASGGGEGISLYQYQVAPSGLFTCMTAQKGDGTWINVPGCPEDNAAGGSQ